MIKFLSSLKVEAIDNKYVRLTESFVIWSSLLNDKGYLGLISIPAGFICDYESVPRLPFIFWLLAHTSKRGGVVHDYLYRKDSVPLVPRCIVDAVYEEIMESRNNWWWRRKLKYYGVRTFGSWSYHKLSVNATYEEIKR